MCVCVCMCACVPVLQLLKLKYEISNNSAVLTLFIHVLPCARQMQWDLKELI